MSDFTSQGPGSLVRYWRRARGVSQHALALEVGVSARHLSFVENGRSGASRDLLIRLADHLEIPAREENALLESAGHARRHRVSELVDPRLEHVLGVLRFVLDRHEPNGALVFDRHWAIVMANEAHRRALPYFTGGRELPPEIAGNLLRLTFHPDGLRPVITNFGLVGRVLLERLEREVADAPTDAVLVGLLDEMRGYGPIPPEEGRKGEGADLLLPIELALGSVRVRLFSLLSTIGTAVDVALQELRVETFFPADDESARLMASLGETS